MLEKARSPTGLLTVQIGRLVVEGQPIIAGFWVTSFGGGKAHFFGEVKFTQAVQQKYRRQARTKNQCDLEVRLCHIFS